MANSNLKAITIHQPYASAIVQGVKHYEQRTWSTKYRGLLAIHAAASVPHDTLPVGAIVGGVVLRDILQPGMIDHDGFANVRPNWLLWELIDPIEFDPIPCTGARSLWTPSHRIVQRIQTALRSAQT